MKIYELVLTIQGKKKEPYTHVRLFAGMDGAKAYFEDVNFNLEDLLLQATIYIKEPCYSRYGLYLIKDVEYLKKA